MVYLYYGECMKIGIDIDGVLTDEYNYIIDNATRYFEENNIDYKINKKVYDDCKLFNVSNDNYTNFWKEYFVSYCKNVLARPYAKEIIDKLKSEGNEIVIITARPLTYFKNKYQQEMKDLAKNWLDKNKIYYDELLFSNEKLDTCLKNNIDIMIEDRPENIASVSSGIKVICYDQPYNEDLNNDNITRCYSWYDIYNVISKINK